MDKDVIKLLTVIQEMVKILNEHLTKNITLSNIIDKDIYINKKFEIRECYLSLNNEKIIELFNILERDFLNDTPMHIFLLSILIKCTHDINILKQIINIICLGNLNPYQSTMLEFEIASEVFTNEYSEKVIYDSMRKVHSYNVSTFETILEVPKKYTYSNDRNKNRIVVISEQLLNLRHAPSKIILEQCYTLQKELGYEVFLIISPIKTSIDDQIVWLELQDQNCIKELNGDYILTYEDSDIFIEPKEQDDKFIIKYRDISINGRQVLFEEQYYLAQKNILEEIYKFNPMFIYNMGSINPLADACKKFTTVVSSTMNFGYPVSDAQILLCLDDNTNMNRTNNNPEVLSPYGQIVLKHSIHFSIDQPKIIHNRKEFNIPEDNFVIALVGNRLPLEITVELIRILENLLNNDLKISILIIGEYDNYQRSFSKQIFDNRIHYIGYQEDLVSVMDIADLYLNPPRKGGGTSALISLYAGVPVVTLPDCDVAGNIGERFICNNYDEMITLINRYKNDNEFYNKQREWGVEYTHQLTDSAANLKETITRINQVIMDMEKELAVCR